MDFVDDIEVKLPSKPTSSFSTPSSRRRPRAEVIFSLDDGATRSGWVPPRVARAFDKNRPTLPCPYREAMDALLLTEERMCLTALTELQSRREHSCAEAREKLLALGYREESVEHAIQRGLDLRFIDDGRFTTTFIEERLRRGWGRRKIELELRKRGIKPSDIPGYPERFFSPEDDAERARHVLARRSVPSERPFEKLVRHLMGKGFSYDVASRAARERIEEESSEML